MNGRQDYIGVNTLVGGRVMHWKRVVHNGGWLNGDIGTTVCGRTRELVIDYGSTYPECVQCFRKMIKEAS